VVDAPPRPWRLSGRLLILDPDDRVLLVHCHDPVLPAFGEWWEVPGGGVDPGEDTVAAALREVAEETGVTVPRDAVLPGRWEQDITYRWLGVRRWSRHVVHVARLTAPAQVVPISPTADELRSFLGIDWVPLADLADGRRTYPDDIATILPELLAGAELDAGFAVWS
jgi:8-oxo-dGTP pyrophosphatase MutT (NUDIX family)